MLALASPVVLAAGCDLPRHTERSAATGTASPAAKAIPQAEPGNEKKPRASAATRPAVPLEDEIDEIAMSEGETLPVHEVADRAAPSSDDDELAEPRPIRAWRDKTGRIHITNVAEAPAEGSAGETLYEWRDAQGRIHITGHKPPADGKIIRAVGGAEESQPPPPR